MTVKSRNKRDYVWIMALGLKSFSIVTRNGFGCTSCRLGPSGPMFGHGGKPAWE